MERRYARYRRDANVTASIVMSDPFRCAAVAHIKCRGIRNLKNLISQRTESILLETLSVEQLTPFATKAYQYKDFSYPPIISRRPADATNYHQNKDSWRLGGLGLRT